MPGIQRLLQVIETAALHAINAELPTKPPSRQQLQQSGPSLPGIGRGKPIRLINDDRLHYRRLPESIAAVGGPRISGFRCDNDEERGIITPFGPLPNRRAGSIFQFGILSINASRSVSFCPFIRKPSFS